MNLHFLLATIWLSVLSGGAVYAQPPVMAPAGGNFVPEVVGAKASTIKPASVDAPVPVTPVPGVATVPGATPVPTAAPAELLIPGNKPNISTNTATANPLLAQLLSLLTGGPLAGSKGSRFTDGNGGWFGDGVDRSGIGPDPGSLTFPGSGQVPACKMQTDGLSRLPIASGDNLAGHNCSPNDTDRLTCMVCNLMYECGDEPYEGQVAVARSVMTRVFSDAYPRTVCRVVYQANGRVAQYSWTYENKNHTLPSGSKLAQVIKAAKEGLTQGPNCDTNYYAFHLIPKPAWAQGGSCAQTLHVVADGGHAFCAINATPARTLGQMAAAEGMNQAALGGTGSLTPAPGGGGSAR